MTYDLGDDVNSYLNDYTVIFSPCNNCFSFQLSTFAQNLLTLAIINITRCHFANRLMLTKVLLMYSSFYHES